MQTLNWYANRLRRMTPREVTWRAQGLIRDILDRPRVQLRLVPSSAHSPKALAQIRATAHALCDAAVGCWSTPADSTVAAWRARLVARADALLDHRFTFFGLENHPLGHPIDWNRDHESGQRAPLQFAATIDYRDPRITGDAKVVWEPGRHHQLVVLGRAYRATGDERYAREVIAQVDSWLAQCPFGIGMHWRSPLELAIRTINWVWAMDLIRDASAVDGAAWGRMVSALYLHLWDIRRKYSRGSSANNHRIGEAAAVFVATTSLPDLKDAAAWRAESRAILEQEIIAQTYDDGGSREQALGYHLFVLQFVLTAAFVARKSGAPLSAAYEERARAMVSFGAAMVEGGPTPTYGDSDEGYVLDLGSAGGAVEWLQAGAALLEPSSADTPNESTFWLLGASAEDAGASRERPARALQSRAFADSGYYLLQHGTRGAADALSVLFDCGQLGFGPIAAHGHADALAFTLRVSGEDILIDPGTYDYFRFPEWRTYFRGTRAHNTIAIDGLDQSTMLGPFMWGQRAGVRCVQWHDDAELTTAEGSHDGYLRLPHPVGHRRRIDVHKRIRELKITDSLTMSAPHSVEVLFHFAPHCDVSSSGSSLTVDASAGTIRVECDPRLQITLRKGESKPIVGWASSGYHRKTPTTTAILSGSFDRDVTLVTGITLDAS